MVPFSEQRTVFLMGRVLGLGHQFLSQMRTWSSMGRKEASTQGQQALPGWACGLIPSKKQEAYGL